MTLFLRQGFQDTTVHDIAAAAEISRAAMYQYFASKDEVVEALLAESARDLVQMIEAMGPVGPTREGFAQLRRLVESWSAVQQQYGALFVRWSGVDLPIGQAYPSPFERRLEKLLDEGGLSALTPQDAARLVTAAVHRFVFLRSAEPASRVHADAALDEIVTVLQLVLFPDTPHADLARGDGKSTSTPRLAVMQPRTRSRLDEVMSGLTARSASTVTQIADSGALTFAQEGYHAANVDEIVRAAGFARGTFYKYFTGKLDLLIVLAEGFEDVVAAHIRELGAITARGPGAQELRSWSRELIDLRDQHMGVMRALIDLTPHDALLDAGRGRFRDLLDEVVGGAVARSPLDDLVTPWAVQIVMLGAIDQLPDGPAVDADHAAEVLATVIQRGLLGG